MSKPRFRPAPNGGTIITHTEYVTTISGSTTFVAGRYPINPGLTGLFPWLSTIAGSYDRYKFKALHFYYVPAVATSVSGRIALAFAFDANQTAPTNSQQIFSITPNEETTYWSDLHLDCGTDRKIYYVRTFGTDSTILQSATNSPALNRDLNVTDMGVLFVGTNYGNTANVGELYVAYEVELMNPTASPYPLVGQIRNTTTAAIANVFPATSATILAGNVLAAITTANTIAILASGTYLLTIWITGTVLTGTPPGLTTVRGSNALTSTPQPWLVNAAATIGSVTFLEVVTVDSATGMWVGTFDFTVAASTVTQCKVTVTPASSQTT